MEFKHYYIYGFCYLEQGGIERERDLLKLNLRRFIWWRLWKVVAAALRCFACTIYCSNTVYCNYEILGTRLKSIDLLNEIVQSTAEATGFG